ncbi:MAG TPA: hypothetical protein VFA18_25575 [Gemmataceae bacterium]|nr:hypothetical protein [Gemmataceae bacterium]
MFRSRWGFHPCDYATYRKLKLLNQVYLRAVRLAHAWARWKRKDPHNRVSRRRIRNNKGQTVGYGPPMPLPEPKVCPVFSQKVFEKRYVDKKGTVTREGFMEETVIMINGWISVGYASARRPVAEPDKVQPLHHTAAEMEALYQEARTCLEQQDVE